MCGLARNSICNFLSCSLLIWSALVATAAASTATSDLSSSAAVALLKQDAAESFYNDITSINARAGVAKNGQLRTSDGDYLFEGDILVPASAVNETSGELKKGPQAGGICTVSCGRWPLHKASGKYLVHYKFSTLLPMKSFTPENRNRIKWVHSHIEVNSNILFVERTKQSSYIEYFDDGSCYATLGRSGSRQKISLGEGCMHESTILHEIFHALGINHEHQRMDRDKHIEVLWSNVDPKYQSQLKIDKDDESKYFTPYDYASVMHYTTSAFGRSPQAKTIRIIGPEKEKNELIVLKYSVSGSTCDWAEIAHIYPGKNLGPKCEPHKEVDDNLCTYKESCLEGLFNSQQYCQDRCFISCMRQSSRKLCQLTAKYGEYLDFNFEKKAGEYREYDPTEDDDDNSGLSLEAQWLSLSAALAVSFFF